LAINPGQVFGTVSGIPTKDPAFNMDAVWIEANQKDQAQTMGYTVVDSSTVIATHLSQLLKSHAHELLGREEVQQLLDSIAKSAPKLVEGLVPELVSLGTVQRVLRNLLTENIPIRDMRTIVETLAIEAPRSQDPDVLTAVVRVALGRLIIQNINGMEGELPVITLDPSLEHLLQESMQTEGHGSAGLEPGLTDSIHRSLVDSAQRQEMAGQPAVLLVAASLRQFLQKFVKHTMPNMHVLSYHEIPDNKQLRVVANVGRPK
jgi:flagellar biosynthesis protein FlhA